MPQFEHLSDSTNSQYEQPSTPVELSINDLVEIVETSIVFNEDERAEKSAYYREQFNDFSDAMLRLPFVVGVFGTGYPFYNTRADGSIVTIQEISRYLAELSKNIQRDNTSLLAKWACVGCQIENKLPDLKTFCKPCMIAPTKPRDIFKAIPDLDYWVITENEDPYSLALIQQYTARQGFFPSDGDIGKSAQQTMQAMDEVLKTGSSQKKLPIDLHVITADEFADAVEGMTEALGSSYVPGGNIAGSYSPINPMSLHVQWERPDEPYDFTKDFLLSLTLHPDSKQSVQNIFNNGADAVGRMLSFQDIVEIISRYPKERRQLETAELLDLLQKRWENN